MDIFDASPREKFYDIIFAANRDIVENELDKLFVRMIALEALCEKHGVSEGEIAGFVAENAFEIEQGLNDIYIGMSGDILSQNE
ncbi:DUF2018 family protein [Campylobacter sp. 19-13652]|uniref:DUF2018 family protein n=1 Tax=Campylobacter sp. 19-13652 TaxID=2840180 RepID=UPI001C764955|nr:DUF2018 family protein [Campylobacter sp. 19-13652]BCX79201.1 hypothetical protein LBC_06630 [Campylobacter sp. 19-13652]